MGATGVVWVMHYNALGKRWLAAIQKTATNVQMGEVFCNIFLGVVVMPKQFATKYILKIT